MKHVIRILVLAFIIALSLILFSDCSIDIDVNIGVGEGKVSHASDVIEGASPGGELIAKKPSATYAQIYTWAENNGASELYLEVLPIIWEKSVEKGIDPVVMSVQCALETGFLSRGNAMSGGHNTAGIKSGSKYAVYDSWADGFEAQANLLALYTGTSGNQKSWLYGRCKTVKQLTGLWAEDRQYDVKLMKMINQLRSTKVPSNSIILNDPTKDKSTSDKKINKKEKETLHRINKIVKNTNKVNKNVSNVSNTIKKTKKKSGTDKIKDIVTTRNKNKKTIDRLKKLSDG